MAEQRVSEPDGGTVMERTKLQAVLDRAVASVRVDSSAPINYEPVRVLVREMLIEVQDQIISFVHQYQRPTVDELEEEKVWKADQLLDEHD